MHPSLLLLLFAAGQGTAPVRPAPDSVAAIEHRVAQQLARYRRTDSIFTARREARAVRPAGTPLAGTVGPVVVDSSLASALAAPLRDRERAVLPRLDAVALADWRAETVFVRTEPAPRWRTRGLPAAVAARLPARTRIERADVTTAQDGSAWAPDGHQRLMSDRLLATFDEALGRWLDGTRFPVADDGTRLAQLTRDQFALSLSSHANDCLSGRDDSCLRLLNLTGDSLGARERWYRPRDYPALARRLEPPSDLPREQQLWWRDCVQRDDRGACDRYIGALAENRFPAPVGGYAAALLLDVALRDDSAAVARLRAPGPMAARLQRASGQPIPALLAQWRQRVQAAPAPTLLDQPMTRVAAALGWSALLLGLGASRRRA